MRQDYDKIATLLKKAGIQPTAQRIAICRFVFYEANHPTAEDVKVWVDAHFPKMSLATVYNTLGSLVKVGLLREFRLPHTEKVVYDNNLSEHFHFLDERNGEIFDIDPSEVDGLPLLSNKLKKKFNIQAMEILFKGTKKAQVKRSRT